MNTAKRLWKRSIESLPYPAWFDRVNWKAVGAGTLGFFFILVVVLMHRKVYGLFLKKPEYQVNFGSLTTAQLPSWAGERVRSSIQKDLSGKQVSLLDDRMAERVREVYEQNPWVREVKSVSRTLDGVNVKAELRKPVAAIRGPGTRWYLVDRSGTRLPGAYRNFPDQFGNVYLVTGFTTTPPDPGETWNDPRVPNAARLAAVLKYTGINEKMDINKLQVKGNDADWNNGRGQIIIRTEENVPVYWGRPPGQGGPGEPDVKQKLENLRRVLQGAPDLIGLKKVKLQYRHPIISGDINNR